MSLNPKDNAKARQQRTLKTLTKVYNGEISNLECPYCLSSPLRFSYTFVEPDNYGVWISCTICGKEAHMKAKRRPPGYNERFVLKEFQKRDEQIVKFVQEKFSRADKKET